MKPKRSFIVSAIKSSIGNKLLTFGQSLHGLAVKTGFSPETLLCNHLIRTYAKCESLDNAHEPFDEMSERNLISYSILVSSNSRSGSPRIALHLLFQMQYQALSPNQFVFSSSVVACSRLNSLKSGEQVHAEVVVSGFESDPFVKTTLVDMYSKFGNLDLAVSIFKRSQARDPVLFNSMVSGYVSFGAYEEALHLFKEERKFVYFKPTKSSFGSLAKACSDLNKEVGKQLHSLILIYGFNSNCFIGSSLVVMYGMLGDVESFEKAFEDIISYDIALYNAILTGYSRNGLDGIALDCFRELILGGFTPNEGTLASTLKSCAG